MVGPLAAKCSQQRVNLRGDLGEVTEPWRCSKGACTGKRKKTRKLALKSDNMMTAKKATSQRRGGGILKKENWT